MAFLTTVIDKSSNQTLPTNLPVRYGFATYTVSATDTLNADGTVKLQFVKKGTTILDMKTTHGAGGATTSLQVGYTDTAATPNSDADAFMDITDTSSAGSAVMAGTAAGKFYSFVEDGHITLYNDAAGDIDAGTVITVEYVYVVNHVSA